ncbi:MAG: response regulator [Nitrospirota bacterium]|nr:response regulator [Nitrospirota bacterium]MDP2382276.1 response regulator [Nitrospirota bacterium]MDP3598826.1 response regulator [Nitrospirota bacterium]
MATILIVDDDATIRTFLCRILEEDGHEVREAANGQIGLKLYRQDPTDLMITDILMPKRDGIEVTLALTREFMEAHVIAMSGATDARSLLDIAQLFGARHVIQKPFTVEDVRRLVRITLAQ